MSQDRIAANSYSAFIGTASIPIGALTLDKARAGIATIADLATMPLSKEEKDGLRMLFARHAPAELEALEKFLSQ